MDYTNLKNGNGFINREDIFGRLLRYRSARFALRKAKGHFSFVVVIYDESPAIFVPLFSVFTGNRDLFLYIRDLIHDVSEQFGSKFESDEWREDDTQRDAVVIANPGEEQSSGDAFVIYDPR